MFHYIIPYFDLDNILRLYYEKLLGLFFIMCKAQFNLTQHLFIQKNEKSRGMEKLAEILQVLKWP